MTNAANGKSKYAKAKELARKCWSRIIYEVISFANKPITKHRPETSADKAARRTALATILIAFFTVVLACVGYLQFIEIRDSGNQSTGQMDLMIREYRNQVAQMNRLAAETRDLASAAKSQADLTAKQFDASQRLIASQRASISVSYKTVVAPVTFHDGGLSANFSVILKNDGRLPATKVKVRFQSYFSRWGESIFSEPMKRQAEFCDKPNPLREQVWTAEGKRIDLKGLTSRDEVTVLAGDAKEWQINFGMGKPSDSDIIEWPPNQPNQTKRVYPVIVGCVDYQSGAMLEPHQTGFIFEIERGNPNLPSFITYGEVVPREDVVITQYFFGQGKNY